jgi:hypothetical protein
MNIRDIFKRISPAEAIAVELAEAEMALLKAETGVEWAQASVAFNKNRIKRLKAYLAPPEEKA